MNSLTTESPPSALWVEEVKEVLIEDIRMNPHQPRRNFSPEDLIDLADSIQAMGLIHPPVVRPLLPNKYELIAGERRLRACQLIGLKKIMVIVRRASDRISAEAALIENIQRVDLGALEIAQALKQLLDQFALTQQEMASRIGKKRSTIANYLRLLTLPVSIQKLLNQGVISMGHAKAILSVADPQQQEKLCHKIVIEGLSVRAAEGEAERLEKGFLKTPVSVEVRQTRPPDIHLQDLSGKLEEKLGTKVQLHQKASGGFVVAIEYPDIDSLDTFLQALEIQDL